MSEPSLLERIAAPVTLQTAWDSVRRKAGAAGVDRVSVTAWERDAPARLAALSAAVLDGSWRPSAVLRVYPSNDPKRPLGIPTVGDRLLQRAIADVLAPRLDPLLSPAAWAYRKGRSVPQALAEVERHLEAGCRFFLRTDIESFFDRIDQERLLAALAPHVPDERVLRMVGRIIRARVLEGATEHLATEGVPQGAGLSPLLSNVYLRPVDAALLAAGYPFVRYADDMLVVAHSAEETADALDLLARETDALGLKLGPRKTERGHVGEGFTFLGVRFGPEGRGPARRSLEALHARADELVRGAAPPPEGTDGNASTAAQEYALGALRDLLDRWSEHYGWLRAVDVLSHPVLLGLVVSEAPTQRQRQKGLAARRKRLSGSAPAWVHAALAEQWAAWDLPAPLLIDVAAAVRAATDGRTEDAAPLRPRLLVALAVAPERGDGVLAALADPGGDGLAAALGAAGRPALAHLVREGLFDRREGAATDTEAAAGRPPGAALAPPGDVEALAGALDAVFVGRDGLHGVLAPDARGQPTVCPVRRPLTADRWRAHLEGSGTLALYPLRADGTLRVGVLRVRVPRSALVGPTRPETLAGQVLDAAARLVRAAERLGLPVLHEHLAPAGGRIERRIWAPLAGPLPLRDARALLVRLRSEAGEILPPVLCEAVPANDHAARDEGPSVLLPLAPGAAFEDVAGRPLADPSRRVREMRWWTPAQVFALVRRGPLAPDRLAARGRDPRAVFHKLARIERVAAGCAVLRALTAKALDLGLLEGVEVQTLFEFLGHVPVQGREALVRLAAIVGEDAERVVDRRLARLGAHPVSCGRIRQRLPALTCRVGCDCRFQGIDRWAYPTPVLHTLRVTDIPAFRGAKRPPAAGPPPQAPRPADAAMAARPEVPPSGGETDPFVALADRWLALRSQVEGVQRALARAEAALHAHFDAVGSDALRTPRGTLVRIWDEHGRYDLQIQIGAPAPESPTKGEDP
jgi:RNA-directed DNA polymerase